MSPANEEQAFRSLESACNEGVENQPSRFSKAHHRQLEHELETISRMGLGLDFLLVRDVVTFAQSNGVVVQLRGDCLSSLIFFVLGLSELDPLEHGLVFEHFLPGFLRGASEVNLDVSDSVGGGFLSRLANRYGQATFTPTDIHTLLAPGERFAAIQRKPVLLDISYIRARETGSTRTSLPTVVLHLTDLDHFQTTIREIVGNADTPQYLHGIPLDDEETYELLARGDTGSVFRLSSQGIREKLGWLQPRSFENIAALITLHRPDLIQCGQLAEYIAHRHGKAPEREHPIVENVLRESYGLVIYEEQAMRLLHEVGGFSFEDALITLKAMWDGRVEQAAWSEDWFVRSARQHGFFAEDAKRVFGKLCQRTICNCAHARALGYALLAYKSASLKAHFRSEFESTAREGGLQ